MVKLHKKVESRALFDFVQALTRAVGDANGGGKNMTQAENVARVYVHECSYHSTEPSANQPGLAGMQLGRS